jgi:hypothetical protein
MDIDHVYEPLKTGIDTLAAGTGSIQARLRETWLVYLIVIRVRLFFTFAR